MNIPARALKSLATGLALCAAAGRLAAQQPTLTTLHTFAGGNGDGMGPVAGLVEGRDGNFYGTTRQGGTNSNGTVFRISSGGIYAVPYEFKSSGFPIYDGSLPTAALTQGSDGKFYGVTDAGGAHGDGTVFRLSASGTYTNLHPFGGNPDGRDWNDISYAGLVEGSDGNFYGTTYAGGTNDLGTVFQITPKGDVTILHSFTNNPDGANPAAGLVQDSNGNFYGTTETGGTNDAGTVFQLDTNGVLTVIHSFGGGTTPTNGTAPEGTLAQGLDGNFYGTTYYGGAHYAGTVFRITPGGSYTNIHSFDAFPGDGTAPIAGLVLGSDGNFYGTTASGGTNGFGCVFQITPGGSVTILHSFAGGNDPGGNEPSGSLAQGIDGNFYGTTPFGGTNGLGTVFKLAVTLNPPANQISAIQVAGTNVLVTIPSVASEIYQLEYRDSLTSGAWSNINAAPVTSMGGPLTVTHYGGFSGSQRFYRFAIEP